jgi:NADPH:quinone reductase-like Zn-dependent oxidoreductase
VISANIERHKGKWIYVAGAAGGVGHFAAQIAKLYGLKVIGSAGKAASLNLLRQLHLDHIIDYSKQDVVKEIMSVTGGKGADLVYDSTYTQSSYTQSAAAVASGGEYIRLGTAAQLALIRPAWHCCGTASTMSRSELAACCWVCSCRRRWRRCFSCCRGSCHSPFDPAPGQEVR